MRKFAILLLFLVVAIMLAMPFLVRAGDTTVQIPSRADSAMVITKAIENDNGLVEKAIDELELLDQVKVALRLLNPLYGIFVLLSYYFVCTKVTIIPTNAVYKRNITMFVITVLYGWIGFRFMHVPLLNLFLSGLAINALWEYGVKWLFKFLETRGWIKHSDKYIAEIIGEKEEDIKNVQQTARPK